MVPARASLGFAVACAIVASHAHASDDPLALQCALQSARAEEYVLVFDPGREDIESTLRREWSDTIDVDRLRVDRRAGIAEITALRTPARPPWLPSTTYSDSRYLSDTGGPPRRSTGPRLPPQISPIGPRPSPLGPDDTLILNPQLLQRMRQIQQFREEIEIKLPNTRLFPSIAWQSPEDGRDVPTEMPMWTRQSLRLDAIARPPLASMPRMIVAVLDSGLPRRHPSFANFRWRNDDELRRSKAPGAIPLLQDADACADETALFDACDNDRNGIVDDVCGATFAVGHAPYGTSNGPRGHGTLVAGIMVETWTLGGFGPAASDNPLIMPVRILDDNNDVRTPQIASAIAYAIHKRADVINLSVMASCPDPVVADQIKRAISAGIVVVAAAGNASGIVDMCDKAMPYPAGFDIPGLLVVGGTAAPDARGNFPRGVAADSFMGKCRVHLGAPGEQVCGPWLEGKRSCKTGTSFAAPFVAATLAMLKPLTPGWTVHQRIEHVTSSVDRSHPDWHSAFSAGGRLDIAMTLSAAIRFDAPSPTPVSTWSSGARQTVRWQVPGPSACEMIELSFRDRAAPGTSIALWPARRSAAQMAIVVPSHDADADKQAFVRASCVGASLYTDSPTVNWRRQ